MTRLRQVELSHWFWQCLPQETGVKHEQQQQGPPKLRVQLLDHRLQQKGGDVRRAQPLQLQRRHWRGLVAAAAKGSGPQPLFLGAETV